ncbi:MAG: DUF1559 domain-containing protein [Victivallales bacterium]|nr:DUF1559 domain-containing protein [Victivallales bacterium]
MLLPALNQARERAKTAACTSNLKQIGLAYHSYAADYKGIIGIQHYKGGELITWRDFLLNGRYLSSGGVTVCPSYAPFSYKAVEDDPNSGYGYGFNRLLRWNQSYNSESLFDANDFLYLVLEKIPDPSNIILFADTVDWTTPGKYRQCYEFYMHSNYGQYVHMRHSNSAVAMCIDGSARPMDRGKLKDSHKAFRPEDTKTYCVYNQSVNNY